MYVQKQHDAKNPHKKNIDFFVFDLHANNIDSNPKNIEKSYGTKCLAQYRFELDSEKRNDASNDSVLLAPASFAIKYNMQMLATDGVRNNMPGLN